LLQRERRVDRIERRQALRKLSHVKALAVTEGPPPSAVPCVLLNHSGDGAKLSFRSTFGVPDRFVLRIPIMNIILSAEVRWRGDDVLGVEFGTRCERLDLAGEIDALRQRVEFLSLFMTDSERALLSRRSVINDSAVLPLFQSLLGRTHEANWKRASSMPERRRIA
jgi:hypothetical protein